jgi:hypothetical protein
MLPDPRVDRMPRPSADVVARRFEDVVVLLHIGTNKIYELNETAALLWTFRPTLSPWARARLTVYELCDGARTLDEIQRLFRERHADLFATPQQADEFVKGTVAHLSLR